jgi:hypothetical protein
MTRCPALQLRRSRAPKTGIRGLRLRLGARSSRAVTHTVSHARFPLLSGENTPSCVTVVARQSTHAMHMKRRACRRESGRSDHTGTPLTQTKFARVERPIADHTPPDPGGDLRSMKDQGSASRNRHNTSRCPCMRMNRSKPRTAVIRGHRLLPSILRFWLIPTRYGATRHKGSRAHRESAAAHLR